MCLQSVHPVCKVQHGQERDQDPIITVTESEPSPALLLFHINSILYAVREALPNKNYQILDRGRSNPRPPPHNPNRPYL